MFELDKSSAFAEISRNGLLQEIETFLNNITLSNITLHKQFGDIPGDYVKTNAGCPQDMQSVEPSSKLLSRTTQVQWKNRWIRENRPEATHC